MIAITTSLVSVHFKNTLDLTAEERSEWILTRGVVVLSTSIGAGLFKYVSVDDRRFDSRFSGT